jgi:hypothetical protein
MEYLRDPVWLGLLAAVLIPLLIYAAQRQNKALSFEVLADLALVTDKERSMGGLEVRYNQQTMSKPGLAIIRFANSGKCSDCQFRLRDSHHPCVRWRHQNSRGRDPCRQSRPSCQLRQKSTR